METWGLEIHTIKVLLRIWRSSWKETSNKMCIYCRRILCLLPKSRSFCLWTILCKGSFLDTDKMWTKHGIGRSKCLCKQKQSLVFNTPTWYEFLTLWQSAIYCDIDTCAESMVEHKKLTISEVWLICLVMCYLCFPVVGRNINHELNLQHWSSALRVS